MSVYARFIALALATVLSSLVYADPVSGNIFFLNKTAQAFTVTPRLSDDTCIRAAGTQPFTVNAGTTYTYDIKMRLGCSAVSIELDYSQQFDHGRTIGGKVTYKQFLQRGEWVALLYIDLTRPVVVPKPVLFRTACGDKLLLCSDGPVVLTTNEISAHFTVISVHAARTFIPAVGRVGK